VVAYVFYRAGLGLLGLKTPKPPTAGHGRMSFLILVPARNEERVVAETIERIQALDYPSDKKLIVIVADDCQDETAATAIAAGARVLAKPGPAAGKGDTIQWALAQPELVGAAWDALVIFDADSRPSLDYLSVMDAALEGGAEAVQARTESLPPSGWVARAYAMNTSQRNRLWHQAREQAGFSAALTGTGICLSRDLLRRFPFKPYTVTEDLEYSAVLTSAGVRVHFLYHAVLQIEQPVTLGSSITQRIRWARGQIMTTLREGPRLLARAARRLDLSAFDSALYLAMPSLVPLQALLIVWLGASLLVDTSSLRTFVDFAPVPIAVPGAVLVFSLVTPHLGILAERRGFSLRDWVGFLLLMTSWLPLAVFGAFTWTVRSWKPTPHGLPAGGSRARAEAAPPVPSPALDAE
jgi:cellulose synthase/poly-beta-1,6-N-acetylglucosamine synthase-like glycosyltransferase